MAETTKIRDPFLNKEVEISTKLTDRLRGKYAIGPHMPNGRPEFGWRQFEAPPIQHEAADLIESITAELDDLRKVLERIAGLAITTPTINRPQHALLDKIHDLATSSLPLKDRKRPHEQSTRPTI